MEENTQEFARTNEQEKPSLLVDAIALNVKIDCAVQILSQVDLEFANRIITMTPDNLKNDYNYLVLVAAKEFIEKLVNLNKED